jgi:hypothetical protein
MRRQRCNGDEDAEGVQLRAVWGREFEDQMHTFIGWLHLLHGKM